MAKCITCGRPATGDLCEHHNDPRTQWKTISDIEECFEEKTVEIDRLRAENERLRAALRPFAVAMSGYDGKCLKYDSDECEVAVFMDYETPHCFDTAGEALTLGDLRRAAAALKGEPCP